jgi:hypothetical protein
MDQQAAYVAAIDALVEPLKKIERDAPAPEVAHIAWDFKMKLDKIGALTPEYAALLEGVPTEIAFAEAARAARAKLDARAAMMRACERINAVANDLIKKGAGGAADFRKE